MFVSTSHIPCAAWLKHSINCGTILTELKFKVSARNCVERSFETAQDRLVKGLRVAGVKDAASPVGCALRSRCSVK